TQATVRSSLRGDSRADGHADSEAVATREAVMHTETASTACRGSPLRPRRRRCVTPRMRKVMLSAHVAGLYDVEPRVLGQAVKRNIERLPADFMFQLAQDELAHLKSQVVISGWGGMRRDA